MKTKTGIIILAVLFAVSEAILIYPFFANIHNNRLAQQLIVEYEENISDIDEEELESLLAEAVSYNENLVTASGNALYEVLGSDSLYESMLDVAGDGVMGYISIPKISLSLPIYHYSDDEVLEKGIGHIETSSLPVGGASTHCILTGHRGLPGSRLFTDLDQLEEGDVFFLKILGETFAYEVISIETVEPTEVDSLGIRQGEDLCTLVTCTPYGINSHRLLVTGSRIEYDSSVEAAAYRAAKSGAFSADYILVYAAALEAAAFAVILILLLKKKGKTARKDRKSV